MNLLLSQTTAGGGLGVALTHLKKSLFFLNHIELKIIMQTLIFANLHGQQMLFIYPVY